MDPLLLIIRTLGEMFAFIAILRFFIANHEGRLLQPHLSGCGKNYATTLNALTAKHA